jgi:hypothetical protein
MDESKRNPYQAPLAAPESTSARTGPSRLRRWSGVAAMLMAIYIFGVGIFFLGMSSYFAIKQSETVKKCVQGTVMGCNSLAGACSAPWASRRLRGRSRGIREWVVALACYPVVLAANVAIIFFS